MRRGAGARRSTPPQSRCAPRSRAIPTSWPRGWPSSRSAAPTSGVRSTPRAPLSKPPRSASGPYDAASTPSQRPPAALREEAAARRAELATARRQVTLLEERATRLSSAAELWRRREAVAADSATSARDRYLARGVAHQRRGGRTPAAPGRVAARRAARRARSGAARSRGGQRRRGALGGLAGRRHRPSARGSTKTRRGACARRGCWRSASRPISRTTPERFPWTSSWRGCSTRLGDAWALRDHRPPRTALSPWARS